MLMVVKEFLIMLLDFNDPPAILLKLIIRLVITCGVELAINVSFLS